MNKLQRENENEVLLSISRDMLAIRDKNDLLNLINAKLKKFFYFDHSSIALLSNNEESYISYLLDPQSSSKKHTDYNHIISIWHPVDKDTIGKMLKSEVPVVFDFDKFIHKKKVPGYIKVNYDSGIREVAMVRLRNNSRNIALFTLFSDKKNNFDQRQLDLLYKISHQLSVVISNIIANEEIQRREKEMEHLLSLNSMVATIKDRNDLLHIINGHLRKLLHFTYSTTMIVSEDRRTFSMFLLDPNSMAGNHPDYRPIIQTQLPVNDGIFEKVISSDQPVIFNTQELIDKGAGQYPPYVKMYHESGIREFVGAPLNNERETFGVMALYSDSVNNFDESNLGIIQGIASLVSIAASNILANEQIQKRQIEKELLLNLSHDMARIRAKAELLALINTQLKKLFYFTHSSISVINEDRETFSIYLTDPQTRSKQHLDGETMLRSTFPIYDGIFESFLLSDEPNVHEYEKIINGENPPQWAKIHYEVGLREIISIPLYREKEIWGALHFYSDKQKTFTTNYLHIIKGVASQISIAIANIEANEQIRLRDKEQETLLALGNKMARVRDKNELLTLINTQLKKLFYFTHSSISAISEDGKTFIVYLTDPESRSKQHPQYTKLVTSSYPVKDGFFETFLLSDEPTVYDYEEVIRSPAPPKYSVIHYEAGLRESVSIPLYGEKKIWGVLHFYSDKKNTFTPNYFNIIKGVASQMAIAVANILANEEIDRQLTEINNYKLQLEEENLYLQQEIDVSYNHSEIIGAGSEMQKIFHLLSQVAFTSSTVMILGETGTGKELIARAIHNASSRKDKLMVKVNCAALPASLIESELFGHERGSFTGATERRIGKFELANHSTLFLDEIGEMPLDLQVKLLRVLQEKEIERVGGKNTIKIDVRIIAATNRNLQKEVDAGRFRSDLFYRLNVFPITLPSLRDRKEDIPVLASHFIARYSKNAGKNITNISHRVLQDLMAYNWPGNVRELEHLVERSVLLTSGSTIKEMHLPVRDRNDRVSALDDYHIKTIDENERDHILNVLKKCNGKVSGIGGAAELLGIPYSTLTSKIKKLGIRKEHFFPRT